MKIKDFIIDGETIRISKDENGRYWIQYNVGYCPTECGWFESLPAAIYAISKHRHINYVYLLISKYTLKHKHEKM